MNSGPEIGADLQEAGDSATDELTVGSLRVSQIAERFGTPVYIYDAGIFREQVAKVRRAFGERINILFALKANSNAMVAKTLRLAGTGAEIASAGELEIAMAAGFDPSTVQFAGPGKTRLDLEAAVDAGIYCVNLESTSEAGRLEAAARRAGRPMGAGIRVQRTDALKSSRMRMSGGGSRFGVSTEDVPELIRSIEESEWLKFRGLHTYGGTQCFDAAAWVEAASGLVTLADEIESTFGFRVPHLNFGGGFGVPIFEGDKAFDLDRAGEALLEQIDTETGQKRDHYVELGRYLTAPAGLYVARVLDVKTTGTSEHVVLDGGMHHHAAAAGVGSVIKRSFPMKVVSRPNATPEIEYAIGGPLCLPLDQFASKQPLPRVRQGDLLAIQSSGAYGLSFSPVLFLGHPTPAEVLVDEGTARLVRRRGVPEDTLRNQVVT